ncbi:tetratricopeptide repeat protein [Amycolatopsis magusensis]|uniref:tetratricopeptide repeat protein n=1 Tax=Amycolatopsis magusensis TaxID=882444 RepID=UPI0024A884BB|nr:toll/interleukin-1 receptor domain-containing protein [Amycolatopsis magusensis]MDI5976858.1 toll/interleukin-1 receptor domain-containing protein [Amycolatopsis magusensis]
MADADPRALDGARVSDRYDVFICFTRADPEGAARVERIDEALRDAGLRVFRDTRIDEFDPITQGLVDAIASSRLLLAYYSPVLPTRYACQWELTAAFIAAHRHGDPADRVLAVNPGADCSHIMPVELADAKFFQGPVTEDRLESLVRRVRDKAEAAKAPFGMPSPDTGGVRRPARMVGRYPQLWALHSALHRADYPGATAYRRPLALVRGLSGVGKTLLGEQYAYLFRDAFPGGTFQLGPFGHHDPGDFLSQYHLALANLASTRLGLDVSGLDHERLRQLLAERFTDAGQRVLWLVDDVPPDLPPAVLEQMLLPSGPVRTIVTTRSSQTTWDAQAIDLHGLTTDEGCRLFADLRPPLTDDERGVVRRFAERCDGHPFALRAAAHATRQLPGPLTDGDLRDRPDTVPSAIAADIETLDPVARNLLRVAAALAPVPFPPELAARVLDLDSPGLRSILTQAADSLAGRSLLTVVEGHWRVHALVSTVVGKTLDTRLIDRAAEVLLDHLDRDPTAADRRDFLLQHAQDLADRSERHRVRLLRPVAAAFELRGDMTAAGEIHAAILAVGPQDDLHIEDLLGTARVEVACGLYEEATDHARTALRLAAGDPRAEFRAGQLAAEALDCAGRYAEADQIRPDAGGVLPDDLDDEQRLRALISRAVAQRRRGHPKDAVALLEPLVIELRAAPPGVIRSEVAPLTKLELARGYQLVGQARKARAMAEEVATDYRTSGRSRHARCTEAELLRAEATLTLDFTELKADPQAWRDSATTMRELRRRYEREYGTGNALALTAAVQSERALLALGEPEQALAGLAAVEQALVRSLGTDHPLYLRVRHGMGLAHGQLREFSRQVDLLEPILAPQISLLGRRHPETVESHLDLAIALAMSGRGPRQRANSLADAAARDFHSIIGPGADLSWKAKVAQIVVRAPEPLLQSFFFFEKMFRPKKGKD